jgi:hypothetical protein
MSPLNITYKIQVFEKILGFWLDWVTLPGEQYNEAVNELYKQFKSDNSRQYRLIQVKEELIDIIYPRPE